MWIMLARECLKWYIVGFEFDKEVKLNGDNDLRRMGRTQ